MSNETDKPAFPQYRPHPDSFSHGMTLRDYFAAHTDVSFYTPLENLTAQLQRKPTIGEMAKYIANIRYIEADAMLKYGIKATGDKA